MNNNMAKQSGWLICRDESGSILTDSDGNWLIMNPHANTIESIAPMVNLFQTEGVSMPSCSINSETKIETALEKSNSNNNFTIDISDNSCEETQTLKVQDHQEYQHQWSRKAILLLISLYKDHQKHFRDTSIKNEKVWGMIQDQLCINGFNYSKTQIENKFKYLKARYIKKKDNEGSRGTGEPPISFEYYEEFDEIFRNHPNVKPTSSASSLQGCSLTIASDNDSEPPAKKTRLEKQIQHLREMFEKQNEDKEKARQQRHKERQSTMERAIDVYQNTMEQFMNKFLPK